MKCLLSTPRAQTWIQNGRPARILHIFKDVINLTDDCGNVISVSTPAIDPGPFSMIIEESFTQTLQSISLYEKITLNPVQNEIRFGEMHINTKQAAIWNPTPQWARLQALSFPDADMAETIPPEIEPFYQELLSAIEKNDFAAARSPTTTLAGLGQGLTPAGDDFLIGLIFALWVWKPQSEWMSRLAEWAAPQTTTLSAAYLRAAACGEAHIYWHNLADRHPDAVAQILSVGHSSGHDAWSGFVHAYGRFQKT